MMRRMWLLLSMGTLLALMVGGVWAAPPAPAAKMTKPAKAAGCCDQGCCPDCCPGCCDDCYSTSTAAIKSAKAGQNAKPAPKTAQAKAAKASCCPDGSCCSDGACCNAASTAPAKAPARK